MKFSIVTCTFNSAEFLQKNINSIKSQTYVDFEHIFIDGYSSDGTIKIIEEYKKEFPDKVFFYQTEPHGISNAMNEGIKKMTGDYLIHLHSDDSFYSKNVLEQVNDFTNLNTYDWVYGKINVVDISETSKGVFPIKKIFQQTAKSLLAKHLLKLYNYVPHQAVFIKKTVFENYGYFDESLTSAMDYDMWLKICGKTKWTFIDEKISNYMIRSGAQSSDKIKQKENINNTNIVQKRYLNSFELLVAKLINLLINIKNNNYK
jgi:glycosyltransferase involved in cell wall biosynthesis